VKSYHREHSDATPNWRPGEPIPPAGSGIEPNAHHALERSVLAAENKLRPVAVKRQTPAAFRPPFIPAEVRARYQYEFNKIVAAKVEAGMHDRCGDKDCMAVGCCAHHDALLEMGCVEFWDFANSGRAAQRGEEAIAA
jgi:hypothetical protein